MTSKLTVASLLLASPAVAQDAPQATPAPAPTATPTPAPQPTPFFLPPLQESAPQPTPTPTEAPTPAAAPTPRATPRPRAAATPTPRPLASPTPLAAIAPAPAPIATPAPSLPSAAATVPSAEPVSKPRDGASWLRLLLPALALVAGLAAWLWSRRRQPEEEAFAPADEAIPVAIVPDAPAPPRFLEPLSAPLEQARLEIGFRPNRSGLNMLSATVEGEVTVANVGAGEATDVRVRAALFTASPDLDAALAGLREAPITRPAAPPFALAPGETRVVRVVAAAPREALRVMTAGERPMFVPVVGIDVGSAGGLVVSQAFAVGVERVDSAKLAPIWLDVPPRSYAQVAARPHGPAIVRQANG